MKKQKSQWEFGELFPSEPSRKVFSVAEFTAQVRTTLEKGLPQVWVSGEISNLRLQPSGHIYFVLKDSTAQLKCVLFRGELRADRALLQDGRSVTVQGGVTVYEPRGEYQLRVSLIEAQGVGALQAAFERLKQKLAAEGLFAIERKRPLPRFPRRIGVVTSLNGAAIRDVLHVVQRRNPSLELLLAPCRVQGDGAATEIARSIQALNTYHEQRVRAGDTVNVLDLILITRGGGSIEDLWSFNEEQVARAIYASSLPVVSAVGHEIDFTISDFVADLRAATPSAAAEILTEGVFSSCQFFAEASRRMAQLVAQRLRHLQNDLLSVKSRLRRAHPGRRLEERAQHLDDLLLTMRRCGRRHVHACGVKWLSLAHRLSRIRPAFVLRQKAEVLKLARESLQSSFRAQMRHSRDRVAALESRLKLLGPDQVLSRGYSITIDPATSKVVREASQVAPGQELLTRVQKGTIRSKVVRLANG